MSSELTATSDAPAAGCGRHRSEPGPRTLPGEAPACLCVHGGMAVVTPWSPDTFARRRGSRRRCSRLQTCRCVDDVAGGHPRRPRARVEGDQRFTRRNPDAQVEVAFLGYPVTDREGRAHRALGIVLTPPGREESDDRVADELLHRAAQRSSSAAAGARDRGRGRRRLGSSRSARRVKPTRSAKRTRRPSAPGPWARRGTVRARCRRSCRRLPPGDDLRGTKGTLVRARRRNARR